MENPGVRRFGADLPFLSNARTLAARDGDCQPIVRTAGCRGRRTFRHAFWHRSRRPTRGPTRPGGMAGDVRRRGQGFRLLRALRENPAAAELRLPLPPLDRPGRPRARAPAVVLHGPGPHRRARGGSAALDHVGAARVPAFRQHEDAHGRLHGRRGTSRGDRPRPTPRRSRDCWRRSKSTAAATGRRSSPSRTFPRPAPRGARPGGAAARLRADAQLPGDRDPAERIQGLRRLPRAPPEPRHAQEPAAQVPRQRRQASRSRWRCARMSATSWTRCIPFTSRCSRAAISASRN